MIQTTFHADNIRWGDDGFLYVTGPGGTEGGLIKAAIACRASVICPVPFKVLRVDPRTLQTEELVNEPGGPLFGLGTGVAKIGREEERTCGEGAVVPALTVRPILPGLGAGGHFFTGGLAEALTTPIIYPISRRAGCRRKRP